MQTLSGKSYDFIRDKLSSGAFSPGERLVNRKLALEIGVSVIPVREAINRLASEGLVDQIPGAGAFVRNLSRQDLDHLYVLRDALESCAAAEAARFRTGDQLDEWEFLIEKFVETSKKIFKHPRKHANKRQLNRWLDHELRFHELLIEASRNPLLAKVVMEHRVIVDVFQAGRNSPKLLTAEVARKTCERKSELLRALQAGDSTLARQLMSNHIQYGRQIANSFRAGETTS